MKAALITLVACVTLFSSGCQTNTAAKALTLDASSLEIRAKQARSYDTTDEENILSASAAVLQDLGFTLSDSETAVGLIRGEKDRDATDAGQVVGAIILAALGGGSTPIDKQQKIIACVVTKPVANRISVRVTFQRLVWNTENQLSRAESITDDEIYSGFFQKLSKSVFLEGEPI